jgi:hypothetical protein
LLADISHDQLRAVELAAHACGRLAATVESAGGAASDFLLLRHAVRAHDETADFAVQLLLGRVPAEEPPGSGEYEGAPNAAEGSLAAELEKAGLGAVLTDSVRASLDPIERDDGAHASGVLNAALAAGTVVAPAPASRDAQRAGALIGALALVRGGTLPAPWVAPWQLDAAARSAAVQVDRSGSWGEWIRVWCHLLTRDVLATESALRDTIAQLGEERAAAREQHRVGATDELVLRWLHAHLRFTIRDASEPLGLTRPTIGTAIERLESLGFATELTGQKRDRIWVSTAFLAITGSH